MARIVVLALFITVVSVCCGDGYWRWHFVVDHERAARKPRQTESEKQQHFEQLVRQGSRLRESLFSSQSDEPSHFGPLLDIDSKLINSSLSLFPDHGTEESMNITETSMSSMQQQFTNESLAAQFTDYGQPKKHGRRHAANKSNNKKRHQREGRHICTHEEIVTRPVRVVESYCKPAYKSFTQRCSNGTLCTAFRVQYDTIYRTVVKYQTTTERKHSCCPGWTQTTKHTHGCNQPVCSKGCKHGGTCIKPDVCHCLQGYTGPSCETDVDECSSNNNKCQQTCINTFGSYKCGCHEGFQLQDDGISCKFQLSLVPELRALLENYDVMNSRIIQLEKDLQDKVVLETKTVASPLPPPPENLVNATEFESVISNLTQQIVNLEERLSKLNESNVMLAASNSNTVDSPSDSLSSLSEQVAILEERLADCTCTPSSDNKLKTRR